MRKFFRENKQLIIVVAFILFLALVFVLSVVVLYKLCISAISCFKFLYSIPLIISFGQSFSFGKRFSCKRFKEELGDVSKKIITDSDKKVLVFVHWICFAVFVISLFAYLLIPQVRVDAQVIVENWYPPKVVAFAETALESLDNLKNGDIEQDVNPNQGPEKTSYDSCDQFYIEKPNFEIDSNDRKFIGEVLPSFDEPEGSVDNYVNQSIYELYSTVAQTALSDYDLKVIDEVQSTEDDFLFKIKNWTRDDDWDSVPKSSELDTVIYAWEDLFVSHGNLMISQRLSNNYQRYAVEYSYQTENGDAVLYYYCKSIYYDLQTIMLSDNDLDYYNAVKRVFYRYNDIASCDLINSDYRDSAEKMRDSINNKYHFIKD